MLITADQILAHLVGDYILQSDWMAENKARNTLAAAIHALCYSIPFLLFHPTLGAWLGIVASHFVVDRFRLARFVCWAKNHLGPRSCWSPLTNTGFPDSKPAWLTGWLVVIVDNTLHLILNGLALRYL